MIKLMGIIVGAGRIGYNLARNMAEKHDITLIDKDKELCEKTNYLLDCYVIHGTGTNTKILEDADITKADFFVATTGNDEVNLLSSVYAKEHGVNIIISRLNNTEHAEIFTKFNIPFINPETSAMRLIARSIVRPTAQSLVSLGQGNAEILELKVKNKDLAFIPISEIENNTDKFIIVMVSTDNETIIPTKETMLGYDDSVAVLVKTEYVNEIQDLFTKNTSELE